MNWLLLFVLVTIALEYLAPERHLLIFVSSGLAILPLLAVHVVLGLTFFFMPNSAPH